MVGRKKDYGSGAEWSGRLATMLFSLFQTLSLANLNDRAWLSWYLSVCAEHGGQAPKNVARFLAWNLSAADNQALSLVVEEERNDTS